MFTICHFMDVKIVMAILETVGKNGNNVIGLYCIYGGVHDLCVNIVLSPCVRDMCIIFTLKME